jgi:hypothetical protein
MNKLTLFLTFIGLATTAAADNPQPGQGFIDVPGGPVWYKVTGTGPGLPILALHGGPGGTSCGYSLWKHWVINAPSFDTTNWAAEDPGDRTTCHYGRLIASSKRCTRCAMSSG